MCNFATEKTKTTLYETKTLIITIFSGAAIGGTDQFVGY